jgi:phosphoenolpyruvate carboxykinase (GTP)
MIARDDIIWIKRDNDSNLGGINPQNGFFGAAPDPAIDTNPNALLSFSKNTIFTNAALTDDDG